MASLVLGVVGRAVLGPFGGIVGTLLGGAIDRSLAGGRRSAGRQAVPEVQAASYGEPIPVVRGRMRLAGNVIWAAPIRETATPGGGKRGGGGGISYSASFAVLLARGPVQAIGRVWADGKLLRDGAGEWLQPVTMRLLPGSERQAPDPLIAAAEGAAPAFRGLAVAVFEDLPLAEFGNRLPNLAFEVIADAQPVDLGSAITAVAAQVDVALPVRGRFPVVDGLYLGRSGPLADAIAPAVQAAGAVLAAGTALVGPGLPVLSIAAGDAANARANGGEAVRDRHFRAASHTAADAVELGYFDESRDYQPGLQRARLRSGARVDNVALPLVLSAVAAKALCQDRLLRLAAARQRRTLHLPWRFLGLRPGDVLRLDGSDWQLRELRFAGFVLTLELARVPGAAAPLLASDAGRGLDHGDRAAGPTTLLALDLPPLPGELPAGPRLWLGGAGASAGWRRADVVVSVDAGISWQRVGNLGATVLGQAVTVLAPALAAGWDRLGQVEVELLNDAMWLESRPEASVLAGANLALLGDELIQFSSVQAIAPRRFRLAGLLRGRRGTEWAVAGHVAGERFVLIDGGALLRLDVPLELLGQTILLRAAGVGDVGVPAQPAMVGGAGLQPLAPVHLGCVRRDGQLQFGWIAQSRAGFGWPDGGDVPVGEARIAFRVRLRDAIGTVAEAEVSEPVWAFPERPGPLWLDVAQLGSMPGRTASLAID
ncbi:phage tail protein [Sandarakinorhabdus sp.]|uniref:phage tail protein n=1 Tax=Sandarakinorhabdus sp. TaxID=1916663 RepID=UPI003F728C38